MKTHPGLFITLEGIDGAGKTTLLAFLKNALACMNRPILATREPGGTALGHQIRSLVQHTAAIDVHAEFLLFAADRAHHVSSVIIPALFRGDIVISDRFADSSRAYQGYGRGLDIALIDAVNQWATQGVVPDVTLFIDLDVETAYARVEQRNEEKTVFEQQKYDFFDRVITGFRQTFAQRDTVIWLDGKKNAEDIAKDAWEKLTVHLAQRGDV